MFGRKKNNFYRYMFQKSFMPLFAMLVVISMAFLIFFRITVVREKQKDRENDQISGQKNVESFLSQGQSAVLPLCRPSIHFSVGTRTAVTA